MLAFVSVAWLIPQTLFAAIIFHSLWDWFIVVLGPRPITYAEAIGLTLTLFFLRWLPLVTTKGDTRDLWSKLSNNLAQIAAMAIWWAIAAVFHLALVKIGAS